MDAAEAETDRRIHTAKSHLSQRLHELERRIETVKVDLDPREWIHNPWARAGAAFAIGYLLGRTHILRPIIGAVISAGATAVARELVSRQLHD
jgi:hypothetical protein